MDLTIRKEDNIRISSDYENNNFVDIRNVGYDSLAINLYPNFSYIEIREKQNQLRTFIFQKKSYKKECDFGWWEDAEVVFSRNNKA